MQLPGFQGQVSVSGPNESRKFQFIAKKTHNNSALYRQCMQLLTSELYVSSSCERQCGSIVILVLESSLHVVVLSKTSLQGLTSHYIRLTFEPVGSWNAENIRESSCQPKKEH